MAHGSFGFTRLALQIPIIQIPYVYHDVAYCNQVVFDDDDDVLDMGPYGLGPKKCAVCAKQVPAPLLVYRSSPPTGD